MRLLKDELDRDGIRSKLRVAKNGIKSGGQSFSRGALYTLSGIRFTSAKSATRAPAIRVSTIILDRTVLGQDPASCSCARGARIGRRPPRSMSSPLAGKLFDEQGDALTPSHAVKGERRYRYYVSRSLMTGTANRSRYWLAGSGSRIRAQRRQRGRV